MTYTIEQLKKEWRTPFVSAPANIADATAIIPELIRELEDLTRQLRTEEITGTDIRLRTIRECAELNGPA